MFRDYVIQVSRETAMGHEGRIKLGRALEDLFLTNVCLSAVHIVALPPIELFWLLIQ